MKLLCATTDYNQTIKLALNINEEYNKSVIFHCYWNGTLNEKHYYSILSCYYFNVYKNKHKMNIILPTISNIQNKQFISDVFSDSTTQTQTFTYGTLSVLNLGTDAIGALPITESYNQAILFPTRLTNAELASLTTL